METCKAVLQKNGMTEPRRCIWEEGHRGHHSPDLTGMKIHEYIVVKVAVASLKPSRKLGWRQLRWIVRNKYGQEHSVQSSMLFSGHSKGIHAKHRSGGGCRDKNRNMRPEYRTVANHWNNIFRSTNPKMNPYKDMPFYPAWNPREGGSYIAGTHWVLENLGPKPSSKHSIDIIEHHKGFWPGNLRWSLKNQQQSNKKHRTMFLLTLEQHEEALRQLGYGIHKIGVDNTPEIW